MNSPLVSICVPFYNTALYIERCVRSIMEQTYPNIEYVFVNDGSTDDSFAVLENILKEYPERNKKVNIITNDRNRGTAYSRRIYTENAHGEYITCVDSDDYVELDMVQCLVDKALKTKADVVVAGYYYKNGDYTEICEPHQCDDGLDFTSLVLSSSLNSMWGKLFIRSLFTEGRSCFAPEGLDYGEDRLMLLFLSTKVINVATINQPFYHYIHRSDSITQNKNERHFRCLIRFWQEVDNLLKELGLSEKYKYIVGAHKIENKAFLLMHCDSNRTRKKYMNLYAEEERIYNPKLTRGVALMYWLTKHHLWALTYCYQCYIRWLDYKKNHSHLNKKTQ